MTPAELKAADLFLEAYQSYVDGNEKRAFQLAADARRVWEWGRHIVPHPALAREPRPGDWTLAKYRVKSGTELRPASALSGPKKAPATV